MTTRQPQRHFLDRANIVCDIISDRTVPSCCSPHQHAVLINQRGCNTIDLQLNNPLYRFTF